MAMILETTTPVLRDFNGAADAVPDSTWSRFLRFDKTHPHRMP
jgi:hypothetical protein